MPYTFINNELVYYYMEQEKPPRTIGFQVYWQLDTKSLIVNFQDIDYPVRKGCYIIKMIILYIVYVLYVLKIYFYVYIVLIKYILNCIYRWQVGVCNKDISKQRHDECNICSNK